MTLHEEQADRELTTGTMSKISEPRTILLFSEVVSIPRINSHQKSQAIANLSVSSVL